MVRLRIYAVDMLYTMHTLMWHCVHACGKVARYKIWQFYFFGFGLAAEQFFTSVVVL